MPKHTNTLATDLSADPNQLAIAGQQIMLDTLRAEVGALQALLPGLHHTYVPAESTARNADAPDDMFDNMPV